MFPRVTCPIWFEIKLTAREVYIRIWRWKQSSNLINSEGVGYQVPLQLTHSVTDLLTLVWAARPIAPSASLCLKDTSFCKPPATELWGDKRKTSYSLSSQVAICPCSFPIFFFFFGNILLPDCCHTGMKGLPAHHTEESQKPSIDFFTPYV